METETQEQEVNENAGAIEAGEDTEENEFLSHIHPDLREIFAHEESDGSIVFRGGDGNIRMVTDVFKLAGDSRDPSWGNHPFGLCKWHTDSTIYNLDEGDYTLEVIPQNPRYVMVPARDEESGKVVLVRRKERTITVLQSQVIPCDFGKPRTQTDVWAKGLVRDRVNEEERTHKAAHKVANKGKKGGRRNATVLPSANVSGELICLPEGGKLLVFRNGTTEPEISFDANREGYEARNAYMEKYASRPPQPEQTTDA
jgi:hypothetical protein